MSWGANKQPSQSDSASDPRFVCAVYIYSAMCWQAIVRALETMPVDIPKMIIKTDSKYSIGCECITLDTRPMWSSTTRLCHMAGVQQWLPKWRVNGFLTSKGEPVKNAGVIKYLSALLQERRARGLEVSLEYVESHSGHIGNDRATAQANVGAKLQPQQDPDWGSLEARTTVIIENLAHAAMSRGPASKTETSDERPTKIRRTSDLATFIGSSTAVTVINKPPNDSHTISILPTRPPDSPFRSPSVTINLKPTIHDLPVVPIVAPLPVATRLQTPPPGPTAPRTTNIHNQSPPSQSICPQPMQIQKTPKPPGSPLKASKVLPPLVPVSASEIDFDVSLLPHFPPPN